MILRVRHIYNWLKEKDNKYTKSSGYTVQGGGHTVFVTRSRFRTHSLQRAGYTHDRQLKQKSGLLF